MSIEIDEKRYKCLQTDESNIWKKNDDLNYLVTNVDTPK